ncbi:hypothetical protein BRAT_12860 [Leptospira interrogans serovar Bratislava]|nr:hypothetical protein BRAT_12860 [Leptospira interrogans serovar Bratislava]
MGTPHGFGILQLDFELWELPTDLGFYGKTLKCGNSHEFGILRLDFEIVGTPTNLGFYSKTLKLWELPRIWDFTVRL